MSVSKFDKQVLRNLRDEVNQVIASHFGDSSFDINLGNCSYSESEATFKLKVNLKGVLNAEQAAVALYTDFKYGDRVRNHRLGECTIVGYSARSPKRPIILAQGGKRYKATENSIIAA